MATEIRFEPTLFLLLGTSSGQIGWRLKELLRRAYGDIPVLRFLWVDADATMIGDCPLVFKRRTRRAGGFQRRCGSCQSEQFPTIKAW